MESNIKVSIICWVYNHEKFLKKCLDGFVNQKTNFKFEAIIHDDCSTDNSKKIIEEYYDKYPNIIVPIYEKENQYSKGVRIFDEIMLPIAKGKYIAFCEADDYWCDNNKLQKQFDYMEKHENCAMCLHNTINHNLLSGKETKFNDWKDIHKMTCEDIMSKWCVHTSSYFFKKEYAIIPAFAKKYWNGDFVRLSIMYTKGDIIVLPEIMSVYNSNNINGAVSLKLQQNIQKKVSTLNSEIQYLKEFNQYTKFVFKENINKRINQIKLNIGIAHLNNSNTFREYKQYINNIINDKELKKILKNKNIKYRIKFFLKYQNYITFKIFKKIKANKS